MNHINTSIKKLNSETKDEYILRISNLKQSLEMTWDEVADILNDQLNLTLSESTYRKKYKKLILKYIKDDDIGIVNSLDDKLLQLKKETIKLKDYNAQINGNIRLEAREEFMREASIDAAKEATKIAPLNPKIKITCKNTDKIGILSISDWHYGIDIDMYYNKYNPDIARQRVELLLSKMISIIEKEDIDFINIVNLGDMISGRIHLPLRINSRLDTVTQTMEVSQLIAYFLNELSQYAVIKYYSVSDNHSRVEPNKKESLQVEAFSRIIDWYLEERLKSNDNINFMKNEFGDDIAAFNVFEHKVVAVHGDKDKNRAITNLNMFTQEHIDLILSGHMHHFSADESNNTIRLSSGSLIGSDDYSHSLRLNSDPSQLFVVSTKENVSSIIYKINVT